MADRVLTALAIALVVGTIMAVVLVLTNESTLGSDDLALAAGMFAAN